MTVVGVVSVLVILSAVKQRLTSLQGVEGGVDLFGPLFILLFLLLPLALGVAEIFRHDEDVAIDRLRASNRDLADAHVTDVYDEGKRMWRSWTDAHLQGLQLARTLDAELQEPLLAAADLISQERAHNGTDGDFATLLWSDGFAPGGVGVVDVALPTGAIDPVLDGPVPRFKAEILDDLRSSLSPEDRASPTASSSASYAVRSRSWISSSVRLSPTASRTSCSSFFIIWSSS